MGPDESEGSAAPQQVRIRRAPRYRAFTLSGIVLGMIAGAVLAGTRPPSGVSTSATMVYLVLGLALIGGLVGAGVALLLERRG